MTGIFGFSEIQPVDADALKERIAVDLPDFGRSQIVELTRAGRFIIGRTHNGVFSQPSLRNPVDQGPILVTSGYCADDSAGTLGWTCHQIDVLESTISQSDHDRLANLSGTYQCARVSADGQTLTLISDRFGLIPLFIYHRDSDFAFASDIQLLGHLVAAIESDCEFRFTLDRSSLVEWLTIGLVMGDRTLLRDLTVLPAGTILSYDGSHTRAQRYWRPEFCDENVPFDSVRKGEELDAALRRSLRRRVALGHRTAVSLSGGLDSRLLIGAALREELDITALTFGPEDSKDHAIAADVADALSVAHHRFFDHPDAALQVSDLGIRRTSGMANTFDFWGLQHGAGIREVTDILINGIGGNELLGFLAFDLLRFQLPRSRDYLTHWLLRKLNPGWSESEIRTLRQAIVPDAPTIVERIHAFWENCPTKNPVTQIYHFYFEEKSRKSNALGVATDDLFVEPVAPFLDYDVADIGLQLPPSQRLLARFYRQFFSRYYPDLAAIPYSRTGLPVSATTTRILSSKLARRASGRGEGSSKWATWLRHDVTNAIKSRLLADNSLLTHVIPGEIIQSRITDVMNGDASATMAVGQLLSLESFLRQFKTVL